MTEDNVKVRHLGNVKCPACGVLIVVNEKETIEVPFQKKVSTKELVVEKAVQTTLTKTEEAQG